MIGLLKDHCLIIALDHQEEEREHEAVKDRWRKEDRERVKEWERAREKERKREERNRDERVREERMHEERAREDRARERDYDRKGKEREWEYDEVKRTREEKSFHGSERRERSPSCEEIEYTEPSSYRVRASCFILHMTEDY